MVCALGVGGLDKSILRKHTSIHGLTFDIHNLHLVYVGMHGLH